MRKLQSWFKNQLIPCPSTDAKDLMQLLMIGATTEHQINTFECLKQMFEIELKKKEVKAANECKLINLYIPREVRVSHIDIKDPIFEQPLKN